MGLSELTALNWAGRYRGPCDCRAGRREALERIKDLEPSIHAYVTVDEEGSVKTGGTGPGRH